MLRTIGCYLMRAALFGLLALLCMPAPAAGGPALAYSVITNAEIDKIWRKAQGPLAKGFNFVTPEFRLVRQFTELDIDASLREMTFPVDIYEDRGITSLPEGGREAEPMSVNAEDATIVLVHLNGRFTISKRARWAQARDPRAALARQLTFQGRKKVEAMGRHLGDQFYGYSNGTLAQCDGSQASAGSHTIALKNAYGDSDIAGTTSAQKKYLANLFKKGDRVALVQGGALVANAIGTITAHPNASTPSITVTWNGNVTITDGDNIVLANGTNASTIDHTSYNRHLVGVLDFCKSTSVHGISKASAPNWDVAYSDTSAGRFNGQKWRKGVDEIHNYGMDDVGIVTLMSQGVYRDVLAQYQAGLRFDDAFDLEIDGDIKGRGKRFKASRRVPPGFVVLYGEGAVKKKTIHDDVNEPGWSQAKELIDDSGYVFAIDWSGLLATQNRKLWAYFANQTEL